MSCYGIIHCHSEHSLKDGAMSIHEMVETAKGLGAKAITLTDHGTCTGWIEFLNETKANGILGIPGVEAYLRDNSSEKRSHLIILAKDNIGFKQISQAVTLSNEHIEGKNKNYKFPIMTRGILEKCFGEKGHVIATSACVSGPLAQILLKNERVDKKIKSLEKKRKKYEDPTEEECKYASNYETIENNITALKEEIENLNKLAKKPYKKKEKAVLSIPNEEERNLAMQMLEEEKRESEEAREMLPKRRQMLKDQKHMLTTLGRKMKSLQEKQTKREEIDGEIKKAEDSKISLLEAISEVKEELHYLTSVFPSFYMEMQYHGMKDEKNVFPILAQIAEEEGVPLVAANDAHFAVPSEVGKRQFLRSLRNNGEYAEAETADYELYLKSDEQLKSSLLKILPKETVEFAFAGVHEIVDSCSEITFPEKHYPKYRTMDGKVVENSAKLLVELTKKGAAEKFPNGLPQEYKDRANRELKTIIGMGFADYLLIVQDYLNYGRSLATYGIGPGRGSAAGSLVCWFLGITEVDPLKFNLYFERFLNEERVTMPDIDADFSEEVRERCVEYVRKKYGTDCVAQIRTAMTQAPKAAIRNAARIVGSKNHKDAKACLKLGDKLAKAVPNDPKISFDSKLPSGKTVYEQEVSEFVRGEEDIDAKEILQYAKESEGAMLNLSVHAAGVIIGDGIPLSQEIPLIYMEKKGWAVQCDMVEGEQIGLLKMDFLGLKNLDILSETLRTIKKNTGKMPDLNNLPQEKAVYRHIFSSGNTDSVFQFESEGMKSMLKSFQPDCFEDLILLVAAYRPGPMQYLGDVIERKHHRKPTTYLIPELEPILKDTYGAVIYQEQVMQIFQQLAGYSLGGADIVRRYMSKKKEEKLKKERQAFLYGDESRGIMGCQKNGISVKAANILFDQLMDFASYAFNKSHATAYALISYQTAYLKEFYPSEYAAACLSYERFEKLQNITSWAKKEGVLIKVPNINTATSHFKQCSEDSESKTGLSITWGFSQMKGMGNYADTIVEERKKNGPFLSFHDFYRRTKAKKNVILALIQAGAFDRLPFFGSDESLKGKRHHLEKILPDYLDIYGKMERAEKTIEETKETLQVCENEKEKKKLETKLRNKEKELENHHKNLGLLSPANGRMDDFIRSLGMEREVLGAHVSGSPLQYYDTTGCAEIAQIQEEKHYYLVMGSVRNLKVFETKKSGEKMAAFTLDDDSSSISVVVFPKAFVVCQNLIEEGAVLKIDGIMDWNRDEKQLMVSNIYLPAKKQIGGKVAIGIPNYYFLTSHYKEFADVCIKYKKEQKNLVAVQFWFEDYIDPPVPKSFVDWACLHRKGLCFMKNGHFCTRPKYLIPQKLPIKAVDELLQIPGFSHLNDDTRKHYWQKQQEYIPSEIIAL